MVRGQRWRVVGVAFGAAILAAACSGTSGTGGPGTPGAQTQDYLPGVAADVYLPVSPVSAGSGSRTPTAAVPVVVLIPGGGWRTADRTGLAPLARDLAGAGMLVVNATYRAADDGVVFPVPAQDVTCAVAFAADVARRHGLRPAPLVVLGHSAGGQLAALAALAGPRFRDGCPYPPATVDGLVGLAGAYDIRSFANVASALLGSDPSASPVAWHDADPSTWVGERAGVAPLSVLLGHGDADETVPLSMTTTFAAQLRGAGHPVRVVVVPGADHGSIYQAGVIGSAVRDWIASLPAR